MHSKGHSSKSQPRIAFTEPKVPKNATLPSCLPGWGHHLGSAPCPEGTTQSVQRSPQVLRRLKHYTRLYEVKNAKGAQPPHIPDLLEQATVLPLDPIFVANMALAPTTMGQKPRTWFRHFGNREIIAQGGVHQNRDLVDTKSHASCAARQNKDKQTAFPTSWGKAERTN